MSTDEPQSGAREEPIPPEAIVRTPFENPTQAALWGILILAVSYTLYFASALLIPIAIAVVLNIVLSPLSRLLKRKGVPYALSAIVLVVMLVAIPVAGFYSLSTQVAAWVDRAPELIQELPRKLQRLRDPIDEVVKVSEDIQEAAGGDTPARDKPQEVVVSDGSSPTGRLVRAVREVGISFVVSLFLLLLLLSNGELFTEKIIEASSRFRDKRRALMITREIGQQVAHYLAAVTLINIGLGVIIGAGAYLLGMPDAILLGIMAALLNFIPYFGAIVGALVTGAISIVTFDTLSGALIAPLFYIFVNSIEGYFVTPMVLSRRLTVNAIVIFVSVILFGFLWGVAGVLLAVPIVVIAKVICDHVEPLQGTGQFLAGRGSVRRIQSARPSED